MNGSGARQGRATVLVIEDDPGLGPLVTGVLQDWGYTVWQVERGDEALDVVRRTPPDLIILDLVLPDMDGLVLCTKLRKITDRPIIICSASVRRLDQVLSLELGADRFLAKPFDLDQLEAHVQAVLRLTPPDGQPHDSTQPARGDLIIDTRRHRVTLDGHELHLTTAEFRLLSALERQRGEFVPRTVLAQCVWEHPTQHGRRALDAHLHRLRAKLRSLPAPAPAILSTRGGGYCLARADLRNGSTAA